VVVPPGPVAGRGAVWSGLATGGDVRKVGPVACLDTTGPTWPVKGEAQSRVDLRVGGTRVGVKCYLTRHVWDGSGGPVA